ncbi:glycosyltransferase [Thioalkalivibrio sp. ALJ1]|uniref:glycosyltransferase n=1 Tax=Thioalkalivibrio sp. ALJ1 TaxID=1158144 RepID=UPI00056F4197|nr:glycosyltransferase [Thioalkalivibrio sp. ALJ1]
MTRIVFVGDDPKARQFVEALRQHGRDAEAWGAYPFTAWKHLLARRVVSRGDVIVIRYLNDNPSWFVSIGKPFGDVLTLLVARVRGIRVYWLCHNLDRETESYWPLISSLRRWLYARQAEAIAITDPALMAAAPAVFGRHRHKVFPMSMGLLPKRRRFNKPELEDQVRNFFSRDPACKHQLNILCAGVSGPKYLHFDLLPVLEERLRQLGWSPRIAVVTRFLRKGEWSRGKNYRSFINWCEKTPSVLLVKRYIDLDESEWADDVDLIWRAMGDWSFAFTLLNAARARIPVLAFDSGGVGAIVRQEEIGATVAWDFSNLGEAVQTALSTPSENYEKFLGQRSWSKAAQSLSDAIDHGGAKTPLAEASRSLGP